MMSARKADPLPRRATSKSAKFVAASARRRASEVIELSACHGSSPAPSTAWAAASRAIGTRNGEQRHVVEPGVVEEGDRLGVAAVLAAHAELEVGLGRAAPLGADADQLADAGSGRWSRTGCASAGPARGRPASSGPRRRRG